jgi:hypothetical protein
MPSLCDERADNQQSRDHECYVKPDLHEDHAGQVDADMHVQAIVRVPVQQLLSGAGVNDVTSHRSGEKPIDVALSPQQECPSNTECCGFCYRHEREEGQLPISGHWAQWGKWPEESVWTSRMYKQRCDGNG